MPLYKDDLYDVLLDAGLSGGFRVTGEPYFRRRTGEPPFQRIAGQWPCGLQKNGEPDCIWMKQDGTPVAAFEVEGYDVEDKYTGGLMKDGIYLSSPVFSNAVRAIILFGLREDRCSLKNSLEFPMPLGKVQQWAKMRGHALGTLYGVPADVPIILDDEVPGLLQGWQNAAQQR